MAFDNLDYKKLKKHISNTKLNNLVQEMIFEDFNYLLNIMKWISFLEPKSFTFYQFDAALYLTEFNKILLLHENMLDISDFSIRELLNYTDSFMELNDLKNNKEYEKTYNLLTNRINRIKNNAVVNQIDLITKKAKMTDEQIEEIIIRNNYNIYDILVSLISMGKTQEKYQTIELVLNGMFVASNNTRINKEPIDPTTIKTSMLRKGMLGFNDGQAYFIYNMFDDTSKIRDDVNPLLLGLETDRTESAYYKMRKRIIN